MTGRPAARRRERNIEAVEEELSEAPESDVESFDPFDDPKVAYAKHLPAPKKVYVLDFFSGCGGMSYGFTNTRQSHLAFQIVAGIDKDPTALETYRRNIKAPGVRADIHALGKNPDLLTKMVPEFDPASMRPLVFIGCAPCQGFSALRKGDDRDDARNSLMLDFALLVDRYRPDVVVMENVPEILNGRFSHYFSGAAAQLKRSGYKLTEGVLDLSRYGVPQRRRRAVVLGSLTSPLALPSPILEAENALTVRAAISHLRPLQAGEQDPDDFNHRAPEHTRRLVSIFEQIPPDGGDRRSLPSHLQIAAHKRLDKSATPGFTDVYGRLRWDTPSVTITAKSRSPSSGRFLHPEQHRNITVREAACLQGFPPRFVFCGPPTRQYRQVGEAVPPIFARFVANAVLDHFRPLQPRVELSTRWPRPSSSRPALVGDRKSLAFVDAFCGAGGLSLGFVRAGLHVAAAFDNDGDAIESYKRNVSNVAQVASIDDPALPRQVSSAVGDRPFVVVGGPPCQGFSHQRRGDAHDPRNHLVLRFADFIESLATRPLGVVLENVTDLELPRGRDILATFVKRLARMGFTEHRHVLNSADFGVAQLRKRIIMVFLGPELTPNYRGPVTITGDRWLSVGDVLAELPEPSESTAADVLMNHIPSQETEINRRRIAYVGMGQGRHAIPSDLQLPCHAGDYRGHRDVYGRLDWFSLARTITGGFDSYTRGEFAHPFRNRSITHREGARLQGFPDWFVFTGNRAATRRQIGNAVPPGMAFAIAEALKTATRRSGGR
jgi:DNA-cytosine methyltransferase